MVAAESMQPIGNRFRGTDGNDEALTSIDDQAAIMAAVLAGADGYVLKQIHGANLVDAVRQVAAGRSLLDPSVTAQVLSHLRDAQQLLDKLVIFLNELLFYYLRPVHLQIY